MNTISIIIPVLNEAAALAVHLPLLQAWRDAGHEVVVVDGGSSDQSLSVCHSQSRSGVDRLLSAPPGRASQMNAGARVAKGDLLLFLHIDTQLPGFIPLELSKIGADSRAPRWGRFDLRLTGRQPVFRLIEFMINLRSRITGIATGDQAIFVQRVLLLQMGGFPALPLMEDVRLSAELKRLAGKPLCLPEFVISDSRRWEQRGVWRTIWLMWRLRLAFFMGADPLLLHQQYYRRPAPVHCANVQRPDSTTTASAGVVFFARTPVPGKVKTRFIPTLGEEGALALHCHLISLTWRRTHTGLRWPMTLWMSEPGQEDWFIAQCPGAGLAVQQGDDLGQRMAHALTCTLQHHALAIVIGADCASLDAGYLDSAIAALQQGADVVLGPAEDGGYVLLGVRQQVPAGIFESVEWGTERVLAQTRAHLRRLSAETGLVWEELAPRWDVDRPEDLPRLAQLGK